MPTAFFVLLLLLMLAGGSYLIWRGLYFIRLGRESAYWPTTQGKVSRSYLHSHTHTTQNQDGTSSSSTSYSPHLRYTYEVNGVWYRSNTIVLGYEELSMSRLEAEAYLDNYPTGAELTVFYNPQEPSMSVLIPGRISYGVSLVIGGVIFTVVLLAMIFFLGFAPKALPEEELSRCLL